MESLLLNQSDKLEKLSKAERNFKKTPKDRINNNYISTKLEILEDLWKEFKISHADIVARCSKTDKKKLPYFVSEVYKQFEETYTQYKCSLKEKFESITMNNPPAALSVMSASTACEVKLPRIQLPTFSGKYNEWQTFYDMFVSLIHNNKSLNGVQKLHYLKSSLRGEPENVLRNLSTTESNYEEAWRQLTKRYNNKKYNCNAILKILFSQRQITIESASAIKQLLDTTSSCLKALGNLGVETQSWDALIIYLVVSKLDTEFHRQWEIQQSQLLSEDLPSWEQLVDFLESRFRALEMVDAKRGTAKTNEPAVKVNNKAKTFHTALIDGQTKQEICCSLCNGPHLLFQCKKFGLQTPRDRQEYVQTARLCFNCLSPTHGVKRCHQAACCRRCGRRHHSLLHVEKGSTQGHNNVDATVASATNAQPPAEEILQSTPTEPSPEKKIVVNFSKGDSESAEVLLPTAVVKAAAKNSCNFIIRALLDQCSQASFVTEATVQLLGLKRTPVNAWVSGLGEGDIRIKHVVLVSMQSRHSSESSIQVEAYVLRSFPTFLPTSNIKKPDWPDLENLPLADPEFASPGRIDILLGSEVYSQILLPGLFKHPQESLITQDTMFGWIISGRGVQESTSKSDRKITLHIHIKEDHLLKMFWELEDEPNQIEKKLTKNEIKCEEIFDLTTTRTKEGRFVVKLPFENEDPECQYGKMREIAEKRYQQLERKFARNPKLHTDYQKVLQEYVDLNHMRLIDDQSEVNYSKAVYLPHHAVVRDDKETTKLRVVFDASCKGANNVSLNDNLLVGPKLQQDLRHILMRWRTHPIAVVADLVKMYRQVRVRDEDTNFQRILWRPATDEPLQHYKLLTLTFGTACAPYLAVKSLQKLADIEQSKHPVAARITKTDYYVDDLMTGCESESEGEMIYEEMNKLMKLGGFQLQKWSSSSKALLNYIGKANHKEEQTIPIKADNMVKVLGIGWNRETDNFEYTINLPEVKHPVTKRQVLSDIARLYDPMGWIAPVVVVAKVFIQNLWKAKLSWDDELPSQLLNEWLKFRESLLQVRNIVIPRWINATRQGKIELHAFSDASRAAFAAVVYARIIDEHNNVHVSILSAKTRVAPIEKEISIPRLELCGATLAAKLISEVSQIMKVPKDNLYAWSDSTVVLAWLKGLPSRWNTFVSNRVSTILTILDVDQWSYVSTSTNPADCASRGLEPAEIQDSIWWSGPEWLSMHAIETAKQNFITHEEERPIKSLATVTKGEDEFPWTKYSSLPKMLRILSYCRRFLNLKLPDNERQKLPTFVTTKEATQTLLQCIKVVQELEYSEEMRQLRNQGNVPKRSVLNTLCPILDENGVSRVGGRINLANVGYDTKHPIIVPAKYHLTKLLIADAHERTLHGGPQLMLNVLRTKYWIVRARDQVKRFYKECVTCLRYSRTKHNPLMGQLPEVRLKPSKPFKSTGVDYTGPINIRFSPGRGSKSYKGYVCIFVCMATRAIHLEAVSDLTSRGFIAAFRRFTARRGHCQDLYSDNGTNFVGADKQLHEMFDAAKSELPAQIAEILALEGTTWHFIPPHAPNFGGLWEAGVKSMKSHLRRAIGDSTLTYEELATVLTQIEACLNSRPLTTLSDDPNDPLPLTPGHFLVGEPLINVADEDQSKYNVNGLDRWRLTLRMVNDFWKRWSKEYIVSLNQRHKWNTKRTEPNVGDVVIVKEDNLPPAKWILGKVEEKHPGKDGITRVVTIKCKDRSLKRPVNKLCMLPK